MSTKKQTGLISKIFFHFLIFMLLLAGVGRGQLLSVSPLFPNDAATLTITADCSKGNQGLFNYANPNDVYVHVGVITNLSANSGDWRYVKFSFTVADPAANATSLGGNKYQYIINNPRTFFAVPAGETIQKIAILFRNGNGTVVQRNSDGSDMYISIYDASLAAKFTLPLYEPRYVPIPEPIIKNVGDNIDLTYQSSQSGTLKIFFNGTPAITSASVSTVSASPVITSSGSQQVIGEANNGSTTVRDTINFFVAPPVNIAPVPTGVRDGINYETGDTSAILVLRAPGKTRVTVIGDFNNWTEQTSYQMNRTPDGKFFWLRITGLIPTTEYAYQYFVDGTLKIADPYTEKILDPNNDGSISGTTYPSLKPYPAGKTTGIVGVLETKETAYTWLSNTFNRPDKHSLAVYELLVRDFTDNHDWKTLKDSIAYLKNLGINAIEVMPFNEFEGNLSWGYNPDFYFAPDKYYGNKNSLKAFVDECHKNGIAVLMDIALNHSFGSSPMVQLYFDAVNNRPAANNPWFNPVQKHAFNVGYDMNHESPDTKYYFDRITEFWLKEYRLDGFRFDLSKGFTQKQTCDNNGNNCDVNAWGLYDTSRVNIWKNYYDSIQSYSSNSYVILEHFADNSEEKDLSNYGMMLWGNMNNAFNQATMGYLAGSDFSQAISTVRGWSQTSLVAYMESHDEERLMYKNINFGNASGTYNIKNLNTGLKRNEMAAAFCFMIPGPKMIWQFGELGYDYPINYCQNGTVNNNCRTDPKPIKWDYLQVINRRRLYEVYSALLKLRLHPLYKAGFVTNRIDQSLNGTFKWLKLTTDSSNILVAGNFDVSDASGSVTFQNAGTWYDYLTGETITATGAPQNISLQAGEYHLYVNRNVTNVITTPVFEIPGTNSKITISVYPNPVNTSSMVKIELPSSGNLQIEVSNVLGQTQSLYNAGYRAKGVYQFSVNNISGSVANMEGIHFLKVVFNGNVYTTKIIGER